MRKIFFSLFFLTTLSGFGQEICDNAIDDDGDGFIDLNDDECDCGIYFGEGGLVPNHSFEDTLCCGEFNCYEDWENGFGVGAGHLHSLVCGDVSAWGIVYDSLGPLPDGDMFISLDYNEFPRMCLDEPLLAGESYSFGVYTASTNIDEIDSIGLAFFGTPDCDDITFDADCPSDVGSWEVLAEAIAIQPDAYGWVLTEMVIVPTVDMYGFCVGTICGVVWPHFFLDNIVLTEFGWSPGMEEIGGWCTGDKALMANVDTVGGTWQWYLNGVALIGETDPGLLPLLHGEGEFLAMYTIGDYCERLIYNSPAPNPDANFVFDEVGCSPEDVYFENTAIDVDDGDWLWIFGDGDISVVTNPTHTYDAGGEFMVHLISLSDDETCNDTLSQPLYVYPSPEAIIDISGTGMFVWAGHDVGCANNLISFEDASTVLLPSAVVEWLWYFGDGATSTEENPFHTYLDPGIYNISLVATTESGCSDSIIYEDLFITAIYPDFTLENGCVLDELDFENTSTLVAPGDFDLWEWDYGDGDFDVTEDGNHIYTDPGTYTVELIAITETGCRDTIEQIVEVYPLPNTHFEFIVDGISSEDGGTGGCYTNEVQFNSLVTIDAPSVIASWAWVFGDSETSTDENPTHYYDEEGTYTVELTVTSNFGCESSITIAIIMTNGLAFVSNDTTICQNGTATVYVESSDDSPYTYDWSIPSSDDSDTQTLTDLVTDYWVYVSSTSEFGCVSPMDSILITVLDPITLEISAFDTACVGDASGAAVMVVGGRGDYNYEWTANDVSLPDNTAIINTNPTTTTEYCVTVSDGCETDPVSICTETYVPEYPVFTSDTTEGCEPTTIVFTDLTGPDASLNQSTWYMNGEVLYGNPVSYTFEEAGTYTVKLDVLSPEGCVTGNSVNDYITIHPLPEPEFYATPNPTNFFNPLVTGANINPNNSSSFLWYMPGAAVEWLASDSLVEIIYPELVSKNYTITLIETTEYGCVDSTQLTIEITNDQIIYAPNAFTPDGDGLNQTWGIYIEGVDIYDFHLTMFNRWGELIWESYDPLGRWDGNYGGGLVKDGVYVWMIQAKDLENDKAYEFKGMVTVLR